MREGQKEEPPEIEDAVDLPEPAQVGMLRLKDDETEFVRAQRRRIDPTTSSRATPLAEQMIEDLKRQQQRDRSRSRGRDDEPETMEAFMAERQAVSKDIKGSRRNKCSAKRCGMNTATGRRRQA